MGFENFRSGGWTDAGNYYPDLWNGPAPSVTVPEVVVLKHDYLWHIPLAIYLINP